MRTTPLVSSSAISFRSSSQHLSAAFSSSWSSSHWPHFHFVPASETSPVQPSWVSPDRAAHLLQSGQVLPWPSPSLLPKTFPQELHSYRSSSSPSSYGSSHSGQTWTSSTL